MLLHKYDRKYMEIAFQEMLNSRSEHKNKIDPMVGAVIIDKNGIELGKTYRGGVRNGNHAEYTLIERILPAQNLEGSTLYVTLEPCTKRNPPKTPCVKWIVRARVKRVVIGITDPNPDISGRGIRFLQNHGIQVDLFDIDLVTKIRAFNHDFIEYYENEDHSQTDDLDFQGPSETENKPVMNANLNDLNKEAIKKYIAKRNLIFDIPSNELWNFMYKNGFFFKDKKSGSYISNIACILLFGKNPTNFLPQANISLEAEIGSKRVAENINGPLIDIKERIEVFLEKNMRSFTEIRKFERIKVFEYPLEALREAIFNAVVHRDYSGGRKVHVKLLKNKILVQSPGIPIKPLTLKRMREFNAPPFSRNPRISITFNQMKWIEEEGTGLLNMKKLMEEASLRPPFFDPA